MADEFDWLYFPMYTGDTAHAVHLKSLKFRPDGLLASATRYPRWNDDWTGPESAAGWYNYSEHLIDCETGLFLETSHALLDIHGATLASKPTTRGQQIERLEPQLAERAGQWPDGGAIHLACAAASNPAFQRRRALAATKVQPLFSSRSLIDVLTADSHALREATERRFDVARFTQQPAAPASTLFDAMRAQAISWRKNTNAGHMPAAADAARDAAALAAANAKIQEAGLDHLVINRVTGDVIEFTYPKEHSLLRFMPRAGQADQVQETARVDCAYSISLPVAQQTLKAGKRGAVVPLKVKAVLPDVIERHERDSGMEDDAGTICNAIQIARYGHQEAGAAPALDAYPTPGALLLALRAHRRGAR